LKLNFRQRAGNFGLNPFQLREDEVPDTLKIYLDRLPTFARVTQVIFWWVRMNQHDLFDINDWLPGISLNTTTVIGGITPKLFLNS
jgi:hypothetical protein